MSVSLLGSNRDYWKLRLGLIYVHHIHYHVLSFSFDSSLRAALVTVVLIIEGRRVAKPEEHVLTPGYVFIAAGDPRKKNYHLHCTACTGHGRYR